MVAPWGVSVLLCVPPCGTGSSGPYPGANTPSTASSLRGALGLRAGGGIVHVCGHFRCPAHAAQNCTHGPMGTFVNGCSLAVSSSLSDLLAAPAPKQGTASPMARLVAYLVHTEHTTNDGVSCRKLTGDDMIGWCPSFAAL